MSTPYKFGCAQSNFLNIKPRENKMNVGILLFDDIEVLDFAGPFEVFAITTDHHNKPIFNVFTVAEKSEITARNGLTVKSKYLLNNSLKSIF